MERSYKHIYRSYAYFSYCFGLRPPKGFKPVNLVNDSVGISEAASPQDLQQQPHFCQKCLSFLVKHTKYFALYCSISGFKSKHTLKHNIWYIADILAQNKRHFCFMSCNLYISKSYTDLEPTKNWLLTQCGKTMILLSIKIIRENILQFDLVRNALIIFAE